MSHQIHTHKMTSEPSLLDDIPFSGYILLLIMFFSILVILGVFFLILKLLKKSSHSRQFRELNFGNLTEPLPVYTPFSKAENDAPPYTSQAPPYSVV